MAVLHVADSLSILPLLDRSAAIRGSLRIVDLGAGGGFPGLPIAAAVPTAHVTLVDSVGKKARFLEVAVEATGIGDRVEVRAERAEVLAADLPHPEEGREMADVVTARAVAGLGDLVELSMPLLDRGGRLFAWKRGEIAAELEQARRAARALGAGPPTVYEVGGVPELAGHVLVEVEKVGPTPAGYPRDPAVRQRRPW